MKSSQFKTPKVLAPLVKALEDEVDKRVRLSEGKKISRVQLEKETICDFIGYLFMENISIERFIKTLTNEKLYKKYI